MSGDTETIYNHAGRVPYFHQFLAQQSGFLLTHSEQEAGLRRKEFLLFCVQEGSQTDSARCLGETVRWLTHLPPRKGRSPFWLSCNGRSSVTPPGPAQWSPRGVPSDTRRGVCFRRPKSGKRLFTSYIPPPPPWPLVLLVQSPGPTADEPGALTLHCHLTNGCFFCCLPRPVCMEAMLLSSLLNSFQFTKHVHACLFTASSCFADYMHTSMT